MKPSSVLNLGPSARKYWNWDSKLSLLDPKAYYLRHPFILLHRVMSFLGLGECETMIKMESPTGELECERILRKELGEVFI